MTGRRRITQMRPTSHHGGSLHGFAASGPDPVPPAWLGACVVLDRRSEPILFQHFALVRVDRLAERRFDHDCTDWDAGGFGVLIG